MAVVAHVAALQPLKRGALTATAAVAATVAHRIVAADVRRGTVEAAAVYKRNDT